jgi:Zn finger protein HypA/HybF involved in hydrogenase expression
VDNQTQRRLLLTEHTVSHATQNIIGAKMLDVLCFNCGGMFQVPYGTKEITKQCPKCDKS